MLYTKEEVMNYVKAEDVKFIRLACQDIYGCQKNMAITPDELERAFQTGIPFDASAIAGFDGENGSDLFLKPDPNTLALLSWRPSTGSVVRMFCDTLRPDGSFYPYSSRYILKNAVKEASNESILCHVGTEFEFYLFKTDEEGNSTKIPLDNGGYMDLAPADKGENIRREICLTLEQMGIKPESSHHEEGPGQNEIDFRYSDPLSAADNAVTFRNVVTTIASMNGLYADFSPKPLDNCSGNGLHINISPNSMIGKDVFNPFLAGIIEHIADMTLFLNSENNSYKRLGELKAPGYIAWGKQNRSLLIRIPADSSQRRRIELRSPDPEINPHLSFALIMHAGLDGIKRNLQLPDETFEDLSKADEAILNKFKKLPTSLEEAQNIALNSKFIKDVLPEYIINKYCKKSSMKG